MSTQQHKDAIELTRRLVEKVGANNLLLTGHSLGGGLASVAGTVNKVETITFNPAGIDSIPLAINYGVSRSESLNYVTAIVHRSDPVDFLQDTMILSSELGIELYVGANLESPYAHSIREVIPAIREAL